MNEAADIKKDNMIVNILHILTDGAQPITDQAIDIQSRIHTLEVVDLSEGDIDYAELVNKIFACNKVISW
mgnify:FL=1